MAWAKIKIFYANVLANLTATTTAAGYAVANLLDWKEGSWWKASNTTVPMYINPTTGPGGGENLAADYLFISGHNLSTIGATITLQRSTTGAWGGEEVNVVTFAPTNDRTFVKLFSWFKDDYWRLRITGTLSAAPFMAICVWGELTELNFVTVSFDPYGETVKVNTKITQGGVVSGRHIKYSERKIKLTFNNEADSIYQKVKTFWENHGLKNFGLGWETTEHPDDIFLMRHDENFNNPFVKTGLYRNITLNLKGRKE